MRQTDVAPTLARLLGFQLEGAQGRALIGVLVIMYHADTPSYCGTISIGAEPARARRRFASS